VKISVKETTTGSSAALRNDNVLVGEQPHLVQGMGLFSATAIVMGSMVGSGIFIVSADMSRTLQSPALLIAAWIITAAMTMIGALSYGKFLGVFFPTISKNHWLWHPGNGNAGLNTANLTAIVIVTLLTILNSFGVKLGSLVQNIFTSAKILALAGVVLVGLVAKNAAAIAANFGAGWHAFWAGSSWHATHLIDVGSFWPGSVDSTAFVGLLTVLAVVQVGSLFSADSWNNVTFTAGSRSAPASSCCCTCFATSSISASCRSPERRTPPPLPGAASSTRPKIAWRPR
jgi:APA family basic amino acid/polyamine antiporter